MPAGADRQLQGRAVAGQPLQAVDGNGLVAARDVVVPGGGVLVEAHDGLVVVHRARLQPPATGANSSSESPGWSVTSRLTCSPFLATSQTSLGGTPIRSRKPSMVMPGSIGTGTPP